MATGRIARLQVCVTPAEHDEISAWAARLGKSVSTAVRDYVLFEVEREDMEHRRRSQTD